MFGFLERCFFNGNEISSCNVLNATPLKCALMDNQECKIRPVIINISSDEPSFYPFSIQINKWSGSRNNINNPYAKLRVPDVAKNINVKVFNLIPKTNETRCIKWQM